MKSDRCLDELRKIIQIEGITPVSGTLAREQALEEWISEWIISASISQSMIKTQLTSEEMDFLKYHTAKSIIEDIMEDCVNINLKDKTLKASLRALKRK